MKNRVKKFNENLKNNKELIVKWVKRTEEEYQKCTDKPKSWYKLEIVKSDIPKYVEGEDFYLLTAIFDGLDKILAEEGYTFTALPYEKDPEITI
jgi:hypothetical protein